MEGELAQWHAEQEAMRAAEASEDAAKQETQPRSLACYTCDAQGGFAIGWDASTSAGSMVFGRDAAPEPGIGAHLVLGSKTYPLTISGNLVPQLLVRVNGDMYGIALTKL